MGGKLRSWVDQILSGTVTWVHRGHPGVLKVWAPQPLQRKMAPGSSLGIISSGIPYWREASAALTRLVVGPGRGPSQISLKRASNPAC